MTVSRSGRDDLVGDEAVSQSRARPVRARDLGINFPGTPGVHNAITDVPGVLVGQVTLIEGEGPLVPGSGPIRTGVTVVLPRPGRIWERPVFAGSHRLNGNGEMTGLEWVRESGLLTSAIGLTNTHSVGAVRDALIAAEAAERGSGELFWRLPVVSETWDGRLNDINGQHVREDHVRAALAAASSGAVLEGNVGGGTGIICHGFKGGTGTSSRVVPIGETDYLLGVLVQANHGRRPRLSILGVPVGEYIPAQEVPLPGPVASPTDGTGSIVAIVATDAPMLPHQLSGLAQRVGLGVARTGGLGEYSSGDLFLAFSTANPLLAANDIDANGPSIIGLQMLAQSFLDEFYAAVVGATEEAIVNALVAAETMTGRDGVTAYQLPHARLVEVMTGRQNFTDS